MIVLDAAGPRQRTRIEAKRQRIVARSRFNRSRMAQKAFARKLDYLAGEIGKIVKKFSPGGIVRNLPGLKQTLEQYTEMVKPWAKQVSEALIADVGQRDLQAWSQLGDELGRNLKREVSYAPTGKVMRDIMKEQVDLITSLPKQAGERVHKLVIEGMTTGSRANSTAEEIMRTTHVTKSRAQLIALTETGRAATAMVESRARFIGSDGYIWRTTGDADVRDDHKKLEGKFIRWDSPPIAGPNGMRYHAGAGPRCRCTPEPVIPDVIR